MLVLNVFTLSVPGMESTSAQLMNEQVNLYLCLYKSVWKLMWYLKLNGHCLFLDMTGS